MTDRRGPPDPRELQRAAAGLGKPSPPRPDPRKDQETPRSAPSHEPTRVDGVLRPSPGSAPMPSVEATLKRFPPRKDSPPPISNPRPHSEPTTALELELVRVRTELADQREALKKAQAAAVTYPEAPWWRTTDGMVKVIGAFFAGLALIGAGGWFVSRQEAPQAPAAPTPTADVTCPVFADQNAPRSSLCMRINQIESAIGALQSQRAARVERESREKVMLGERPDVKPGNQPNH